MLVYTEGYELFKKIIEDLQDQKETSEEKVGLLGEKISKIEENIISRESGINGEKNVKRRIILIGALKDKKRERAVLCLEMKDSKKEITKNRSKLRIFKIAQKQLQWGGSGAVYSSFSSE
ncbi:MAG: hypothetical protein KAI71_01820 [Candidatus Pacebacteria bacterium]|nr:hypothetical protein [Candidatus Paceibacterota bacterium]